MGLCHSSSPAIASDGTTVYSVRDDCESLSHRSRHSSSCRDRAASLYSKKGTKGPNQDSAIFCKGYSSKDGVLCGVFDGHGLHGHIVSKIVSDKLHLFLLRSRKALRLATRNKENSSIKDSDSDDTNSENAQSSLDLASSPEVFDEWKDACISAFKAMDGELQRRSYLDCSNSGTTAVTVIKQGKDLIIANLGDSRAMLGTLDEEGRLVAVQLTTDLKPDLPEEAERIRKKHGRVFSLTDEPNIQRVWLPNENYPGLAMSRAFGDFQLKRYGVIAIPQVSYRSIKPQDQFIILATDGVCDVLSNEEVVSIVWSVRRKDMAAKAVVEAAIRAWKSKCPCSLVDDCSVVCLFLEDNNDGSYDISPVYSDRSRR